MQGRRSSIANALKVCLVCINPLIYYLLSNWHEVVLSINIAVHALPPRIASTPAVRSDLNMGLLTCLYFIMYQEYNAICIFTKCI